MDAHEVDMPRKAKGPPSFMLVQRLSDGMIVPDKPKDDLQAPTVFEDDLNPGEWHEMKVEAKPQAEPMPEYRPIKPIKPRSAKQIELEQIVQRMHSLDIAGKLIRGEPIAELAKPKHNEVHTQSGLSMKPKANNPNAIKRRF